MPITTDEVTILVPADDTTATLICPWCQARNTIIEVDQAVRWNRINEVEVKDGVVWLGLSTGDADFEHAQWMCEDCQGEVTMPADIDLSYI